MTKVNLYVASVNTFGDADPVDIRGRQGETCSLLYPSGDPDLLAWFLVG